MCEPSEIVLADRKITEILGFYGHAEASARLLDAYLQASDKTAFVAALAARLGATIARQS